MKLCRGIVCDFAEKYYVILQGNRVMAIQGHVIFLCNNKYEIISMK